MTKSMTDTKSKIVQTGGQERTTPKSNFVFDGRTDGRTDGMDRKIAYRVACQRLKIAATCNMNK